jgi:chromosome partitioning protein
MARRILFTSQKGGVGKSTLARSAAISLAYAGRKILLADFDSEQRTCVRWQAQRRARKLAPEISVEEFSKEKKLRGVELEYDDIVIDTRGQHDELSLDLAVSSNVIFLPSSFSMDDVLPTLKVVESLRIAGVPAAHVAVVFCRTGGSARQEQHARSILEMNQIVALQVMLPQKDGFVSLSATGRVGREAPHPQLRSIALAMDEALLGFIAAATDEAAPRAAVSA